MNDTIGTKLTQQTGRALIEQLQLLVPNPILAAELTHQQLQIAVHGIRLRLSSINGFKPHQQSNLLRDIIGRIPR